MRLPIEPIRLERDGHRTTDVGDGFAIPLVVRYVLENDLWFRDYVLHYTNAACVLREPIAPT